MSSINKARATHALKNLVVNKVSLVDKAANEDDYLVIKCAAHGPSNKENADMSVKSTSATLPDSLKAVQAVIEKAELSEEQTAELIAALSTPEVDDTGDGSDPVEKAAAFPTEAFNALIQAVAAKSAPEPVEPKVENVDDVIKSLGDGRESELISKALESERIEKQAALDEAKDLREDVAILKAAKRNDDFIEKAAGFDNFGGNELAGVLNAVDANCSPEVSAQLDTILKAANAQLEDSDLFKSAGSAGAGPAASGGGALETVTQEIMKSEKITYEAAQLAALNRNPKLYEGTVN